jgi:hypothetical protein
VDIIGPAPATLTNEEIIQQYDGALTAMIKASLDPQYDFERQILVNQARLNWQFVKNNHFNVPGEVTSPYGQIADYVPFVGSADGENENGADIKLCPPLNLIGGDLYKFMAVMGQNAPRLKAVSDNPQDTESIEAARNADVQLRDLWIKNKVDRQWKALAFHQYTTGPSFIRGTWNTDAKKYGQSTEPKIEVQTGPDGSPMPVVVGKETYANGDAEMSIHSILEVSIPFEAKELRNNALRLELMRSKWSLLAKYKGKDGKPGPLEQYRDGDVPDDDYSASATSAQEARDAVANPSGTGRAKKQNQWRHAEYWLPTELYEAIPNPQTREIFQTQFSDGLYIARVGSVTVEIDNRTVESEWGVCRVGRGEKIMDRPISADVVPLQQAIDDLFGMAIETVLRAITQTIMDSQLIDREAMSTKEAVPAEIILTSLPVDGDIAKRVYQIPPARLGDQVLPLIQQIRTFWQDITGIRPELSGGGQPTQTYREAKQRRDQALMQLAPQAEEMRFASQEIGTILVKLRAKFGSGTVQAQRRGAYGMETDIAEMAQLKDSGWHAEANDDFPMTLADRRDAVFSLLKDFSPEVQQALSVLDPLNIEEIFELIQIPGFESVIRDQKEKTLADIQQLLNEQPIQTPPGPDGAPGQPQPSHPPDPFDNHGAVTGIIAVWMISKTGQQAKNQNPAGFANVQAFWQAHQALATPPPPPPPPPLHGSLALTAKLEDYPNLVPEVMQGAGLPPPPPAQPPVPTGPGDMGAPGPMGSAPAQKASPVPPLPGGPAGPAPLPVQ